MERKHKKDLRDDSSSQSADSGFERRNLTLGTKLPKKNYKDKKYRSNVDHTNENTSPDEVSVPLFDKKLFNSGSDGACVIYKDFVKSDFGRCLNEPKNQNNTKSSTKKYPEFRPQIYKNKNSSDKSKLPKIEKDLDYEPISNSSPKTVQILKKKVKRTQQDENMDVKSFMELLQKGESPKINKEVEIPTVLVSRSKKSTSKQCILSPEEINDSDLKSKFQNNNSADQKPLRDRVKKKRSRKSTKNNVSDKDEQAQEIRDNVKTKGGLPELHNAEGVKLPVITFDAWCNIHKLPAIAKISTVMEENAGRSIAFLVFSAYKDIENLKIAILIGNCHNAPYAFASARHFVNGGADVTVYTDEESISKIPRCTFQYELYKNNPGKIVDIGGEDNNVLESCKRSSFHAVIDCIGGKYRSIYPDNFKDITIRKMVQFCASIKHPQLLFSLDYPSSYNIRKGVPKYSKCNLSQSLTLFLGIPKVETLLCPKEVRGGLVTVDLGVPYNFMYEIFIDFCMDYIKKTNKSDDPLLEYCLSILRSDAYTKDAVKKSLCFRKGKCGLKALT